jgi:uncharacterized oligopeptide transporter (OPT) family protein
VLVVSGLIGGIFDFLFSAFGLWSEIITTRMIPAGAMLADKVKMVFKVNVSAMIFGLGYIIGLKYAAIIAAGSFLSWFVLVPLFAEVGQGLGAPLGATATKLISQMSAEEIFRTYVRQIGIGGIAMAGIIGILRSSKILRRRRHDAADTDGSFDAVRRVGGAADRAPALRVLLRRGRF